MAKQGTKICPTFLLPQSGATHYLLRIDDLLFGVPEACKTCQQPHRRPTYTQHYNDRGIKALQAEIERLRAVREKLKERAQVAPPKRAGIRSRNADPTR